MIGGQWIAVVYKLQLPELNSNVFQIRISVQERTDFKVGVVRLQYLPAGMAGP